MAIVKHCFIKNQDKYNSLIYLSLNPNYYDHIRLQYVVVMPHRHSVTTRHTASYNSSSVFVSAVPSGGHVNPATAVWLRRVSSSSRLCEARATSTVPRLETDKSYAVTMDVQLLLRH